MNIKKIEKEFERLYKNYANDIVGTYDKRNKGSYFHWDREANGRGGIAYNNGGKELEEKGLKIISAAIVLHFPIFEEIERVIRDRIYEERMNGNYLIWQHLEKLQPGVICRVDKIKERPSTEISDYLEIYKSMQKIKKLEDIGEGIPNHQRGEIGEMLFHQYRINEIGHACEGHEHYTCRHLDELLETLHVDFLEEKRQEFGEALAKELLARKTDFGESEWPDLPATEALEAIRRYGVKNKDLILTAEQTLVSEAKHYMNLSKLKKSKCSTIRGFEKQKEHLLKRIGVIPYSD